LLVFDNCSTDRTRAIVSSFCERDPRVRLFVADVNRGSIWNFNRLFEEGRGAYLVWLGAHDQWLPSYLEAHLAGLSRLGESYVGIHCQGRFQGSIDAISAHDRRMWLDADGYMLRPLTIDAETPVERAHQLVAQLANGFPVHGLWRANVIRRTSRFPMCQGSDGVLLLELALLGKIGHLDECLHLFRPQTSDRTLYNRKMRASRPPSYPTFEYLTHLLRTPTQLRLTKGTAFRVRRTVLITFIRKFHRSLIADVIGHRAVTVLQWLNRDRHAGK
jgi:glycosyltransferase involved in cell wall biosynthesis